MEFLFLDYPVLFVFIAVLSFPVYKQFAKMFFGENYEELKEQEASFWEYRTRQFDRNKFTIFLFICVAWPVALTDLILKIIL